MAGELTAKKPMREMAPFKQFDKMRSQMDRLWDSFFERPAARFGEAGEFIPEIDLVETDNELVVKCEAPGLDSKDIDISLSDGVLTIRGEKRQEREEKEENYHLVERNYGAFTRSIQLPKEVQSEKITASYKNGVLKIVLPKSEEAKKKGAKIKIE